MHETEWLSWYAACPQGEYYVSLSLQEVGLESMKICVKDLSGSGSSHDPLTVSYAVIGGKCFNSLIETLN